MKIPMKETPKKLLKKNNSNFHAINYFRSWLKISHN